MNLNDICARIALLRELKEHHEHVAKALGSDLAKLSEEAFRLFADANSTSLTVSPAVFNDGQARIIKPDTKYKPTVVEVVQFHAWLRTNQLGDLIKESVHPATLASWVEAQKESNKPLPPESLLKVFTVETVSIRRAPKTAKKEGEAQ